ncbi:hypothetical protein ACIBSV_49725 [Embleya sp. NPDC050154]|uniref:hypothetical protein n=1 Tax=Embleya sp. NPDC050154 TaxID=3363988 RepID=UPI003799FF5E
MGSAYARLVKMENAPGSKHVQQVTALVRELTGREPGAGEFKAYKTWSDYYQSASKIIHATTGTGASDAVQLLHDVLAVIRELVLTLPDQAPRWVELASVTDPTAEQVQEVNQLHHPSAMPYLFGKFTGWNWLEKLDPARLLPEADRWPAAPYFQRLAAEDAQRLTLWLRPRLDEICRNGPQATARLLWLCRHLYGHATPIVTRITKEHGVEGMRIPVLHWASEVEITQRDARWVDVVTRAMVAGAGTSPLDSWDIQNALARLQETARIGTTSPTAQVRKALVDVLAAHLAVDGVRRELQITGDLHSPGLAGSPALTGAWLAAAACLQFARTEMERGTDLETRTRAWTIDALGGWEGDRLLAVHLLDVAGEEPDEAAWWAAAFGVLARLHAMPVSTPDIAAFVRTVIERHRPEAGDALTAALRNGLGPVPDEATLRAARTELDERGARVAQALQALAAGDEPPQWKPQVPAVWRTIWALSEILPAPALAPWRPVVDLLTERFGSPPDPTGPLYKVIPLPNANAQETAEFHTLYTQFGAVHAATVLAGRPPTQGGYFERIEFRLLEEAVRADADAWAADIDAIVDALDTFDLRTAYLGALTANQQAAGLTDPPSPRLPTAIAAAWRLMSQLHEGPGSTDPDLDERARRTTCQLLKDAWANNVDPGTDETEVITWLAAAARKWSEPTRQPDNPYVTAAATSGGMALIALVEWAVHRGTNDGHLPTAADDLMTQILTAHDDDRAMAVIGAALTPLRLHAEPWYTAHRDTLLDITSDSAPIRSWLLYLRHLSGYDTAVLGEIDPAKTAHYLRTDAPKQIFDRFALTLLHSPDTLGPAFIAELADGDGGPEAVSTLLGDIARALPQDPGEGDLHARGLTLWDEVLDLATGTPGVHLGGAGHFAFAEGLDHERWLRRTLRTVTINPNILFPDHVAARAASSPHSPEAREILTRLLPLIGMHGSRDDYRMLAVVGHAQAVLNASQPGSEGRAALGMALALHADDVDAATAE